MSHQNLANQEEEEEGKEEEEGRKTAADKKNKKMVFSHVGLFERRRPLAQFIWNFWFSHGNPCKDEASDVYVYI